jgi:hypothetical protein
MAITSVSTYVWERLSITGGKQYATYADATYRYHCTSIPEAALTDPVWAVVREVIATGRLAWANGSSEPKHAATSLAVVAAYTYAT